MKSTLTPAQIEAYRRDGYVAVPDFLDADELAVWRTAVDEALRIRGSRKIPGGDATAGDSYYDNVFIQRLNLWQTDVRMKSLILDERIGRMCCELEGLDAIRVWHDQALVKRPWDNPTAWHLDDPYWSFDSSQAISIWIALDDATRDNGCLYFLPGSHRLARFETVGIGENMKDLFKMYPAMGQIPSVAAPLPAGGCSFHNGLTAHGAGANMTIGWRRAMTCAFMPDGCLFNGKKNILSKEQFERLKIGDPLVDDHQNPIVYARPGKGRRTVPESP